MNMWWVMFTAFNKYWHDLFADYHLTNFYFVTIEDHIFLFL